MKRREFLEQAGSGIAGALLAIAIPLSAADEVDGSAYDNWLEEYLRQKLERGYEKAIQQRLYSI